MFDIIYIELFKLKYVSLSFIVKKARKSQIFKWLITINIYIVNNLCMYIYLYVYKYKINKTY